MKTPEHYSQILKGRLKSLENKVHQIDAELTSHNSRDWEEMATEREPDQVLERMGVSAQGEIRAIKAALGRVDAKEFGDCVSCSEAISEERLEILPHTPLCKKCAIKLT